MLGTMSVEEAGIVASAEVPNEQLVYEAVVLLVEAESGDLPWICSIRS